MTTAALLACILTACAPSAEIPRRTEIFTEWTIGDFRVRFQAGPKGENGKLFSSYQITHAPAGRQERSLVKESAHTLEGLGSVTNGDPKNWIKIVQDPSERALLIEEEIPNECGPCSNYLWVHRDERGVFEGAYLKLPSKIIGPPGGIDYQFPKVRSLNNKALKYHYTQGETVTQSIDDLEKSDSPTPPG